MLIKYLQKETLQMGMFCEFILRYILIEIKMRLKHSNVIFYYFMQSIR